VTLAEGRPIVAVALAPRDDRLLAATADRMELWRVDATHPEVNLKALFGKIWYEGYNEPEYVWQSSAASDSFEPKYSLVPLIFGTLKATFYSMLIGLPLALLAAIYTSEFLHPRVKARVKPVIEMMASLPSVVLGFLAALVFAPFVEKVVPQTLTAFAAIPFAFLLGAHLWQLVPRQLQLRFERAKLPLMLLMLPLGIWLAALFGPLAERALFAGDIMSWLDGQIGSGLGAWVIILLPLSAALVAYGNARLVNPWLRGSRREWTRVRFALVDLLRFLVSSGAVLVVALALSGFFSSAGWDPRGAYVDTYVQRNALIVGFVMGFAIIPIIYTISDDALAAVPDHLRAASLGAGATPWQTAMLVVVPPAMSGLFSATMIGLGRAVGETMIVLMAAGNTPLIDWNIFNGFRTLSANIAVELPEAVQNSAHYRTLFLAALTLFLMTFVLNTVAEAVRTHYRKKAFEL
jgi:phosphate transport system permease protein